jgi:hypothetical protein
VIEPALKPCKACLLAGLISFAGGCASREGDSVHVSRVGFDPPVLDLGRVPWETEHPVSAKLVNHSSEPIRIAALRSSCDCTGLTTSDYVNREIGPGQALAINAALRVGGALGQRNSEIQVLTDKGTVYWLGIRYDGYATFTWQPGELDFGSVDISTDDDEGDEAVRTLVVRGERVRVTGVDSNVPWVDAAWDEVRPGEATVYVHVTRRNLAHDTQIGLLTVHTDDPHRAKFSVRVRVTGVAALRALPGHAFVRRGRSTTVHLVRADGTRCSVASAEADENGLRIEFVTGGPSVTAFAAKDASAGVHRLHVHDSNGSSTRVLLSGAVYR